MDIAFPLLQHYLLLSVTSQQCQQQLARRDIYCYITPTLTVFKNFKLWR